MTQSEWKPEGMIQPLWATPIYQNQAKDKEFDEIQEELNTIISKLKFEEAKGWGPHSHDLSENAFDTNFLYDNKCLKTLGFIHKCLMEYLRMINAQDCPYALDGAWITKTKKGKFAYPHSHGFSDVSGVYYINTNGEDGNLMFENINDALGGNFIYNCLGGGKVPAPLGNGIMLLWPSTLRHQTQENTTDNERVSLSFNINFARKGFVVNYGEE
tara:strand:+ start:66 stop:707 length:642 start_codon:yes stop_codon:yes gene_type:complete